MSGWNPRYLAYCAAHGRGPEEMLAFDRARWKGGANTLMELDDVVARVARALCDSGDADACGLCLAEAREAVSGG